MNLRALSLLVVLGSVAVADTSSKRETVDPRQFSLLRSFAAPHASILSPSGRFLMTYSGTGGGLYDLSKEQSGVELDGQTGNIHDGRFSGDGRYVATSGYDGKVRVWDTASGKEIHSIEAHAGYA